MSERLSLYELLTFSGHSHFADLISALAWLTIIDGVAVIVLIGVIIVEWRRSDAGRDQEEQQ